MCVCVCVCVCGWAARSEIGGATAGDVTGCSRQRWPKRSDAACEGSDGCECGGEGALGGGGGGNGCGRLTGRSTCGSPREAPHPVDLDPWMPYLINHSPCMVRHSCSRWACDSSSEWTGSPTSMGSRSKETGSSILHPTRPCEATPPMTKHRPPKLSMPNVDVNSKPRP